MAIKHENHLFFKNEAWSKNYDAAVSQIVATLSKNSIELIIEKEFDDLINLTVYGE